MAAHPTAHVGVEMGVEIGVEIGAGIVVPLVVLVVVLPAAYVLARRRLAQLGEVATDRPVSAARLTSDALRRLAPAGWRVVPEIPAATLDEIDHVLVGPAGVLALTTTMRPMPATTRPTPDARDSSAGAVAAAALARTTLDDLLGRVGLSSTAHVTVHWGPPGDAPPWAEQAHGAIAVDGRRLGDWLAALSERPVALTPSQVDLAWRTVTTGIGRPDPLG